MLGSGMRVAVPITLTDSEREKLSRLRSSRATPYRLQERATIVLLAAEGLDNTEIAGELGQNRGKVGRWRKRYAEKGLAGIEKDKCLASCRWVQKILGEGAIQAFCDFPAGYDDLSAAWADRTRLCSWP